MSTETTASCGPLQHNMLGGNGKCVKCGMTFEQTEAEYNDAYVPTEPKPYTASNLSQMDRIEAKMDRIIAQQDAILAVFGEVKEQAEPLLEQLKGHPMAKMLGIR